MAPAHEVLVVPPPRAHLVGGVADQACRSALLHRLPVARGGRRVAQDEAAADETQEKIGFEYVEGPVTPKPEKLPGARKRKPKPSGPSGGSKGPASRGPLVKV